MDQNQLQLYLEDRRKLINAEIEKLLPLESTYANPLISSMRYSVIDSGKRFRPILTLSACEAVGGDISFSLIPACAIEFIHNFSLIHDDLPCMDNDTERRGKPTTHVKYGEPIALLAGDALLTMAFNLIGRESLKKSKYNKRYINIVEEMAEATGYRGMIAGQVVDIELQNDRIKIDGALLDYLHTHKTGALIRASIRIGAIIGGCSKQQLKSLTNYSHYLGLTYQIIDDILDYSEDKFNNTFPAFYGLKRSQEMAQNATENAISAISKFGESAQPLRAIAMYLLNRKK